MHINIVFFQEQLKNGTVSLQILLNAIPYNSSKTSSIESSIYSTAVTHILILYIIWAKMPLGLSTVLPAQ